MEVPYYKRLVFIFLYKKITKRISGTLLYNFQDQPMFFSREEYILLSL